MAPAAAPDTLPADFFEKQGSAPDSLPADFFDTPKLTKDQASAAIDKIASPNTGLPGPPPLSPITLATRLNRRRPQSIAEGLVTDQQERAAPVKGGGAPLVLTPNSPIGDLHAQPVPLQTQRLDQSSKPFTPEPEYVENKSIPIPFEGGTAWLPKDNSPEAQAEADQNNAVDEQARIAAAKKVTGVGGYPTIAQGAKELWRSNALLAPGRGQIAAAGGDTSIIPPVDVPEAMSGVADISRGVGEASTPLIASGVASAPIKTALGFAAGYGASEGAGALVHGKVSPQSEDAIRQIAFWAPGLAASVFGVVAEPKTLSVSGEGIEGRAGSIFNGKAGYVAGITPDEVAAGIKVGPFEGGVRVPRSREVPVPQGSQVPALPTEGGESIAPGEPTPAVNPPVVPNGVAPGVASGHISRETVEGLGNALAQLPPDLRAQAVVEAHDNLSQLIQNQGKVIGPDGKIQSIDSAKAADKLATQWINDEVDRQTKLAEAAKPQPSTAGSSAQEAPTGEILPPEPGTKGTAEIANAGPASAQPATVEARQPTEGSPEQARAIQRVSQSTLDDLEREDLLRKAGEARAADIIREQALNKLRKASSQDIQPAGLTPVIPPSVDRLNQQSQPPVPAPVATPNTTPQKPPNEAESAPGSAPAVEIAPTKHKHGNTQADIPTDSEAGQSIEQARARISNSDLAGDGKDIGGNHVTVRYGINGNDVSGIKAFLEQQAPFEASLGKTEKFPPSEHSDGAAVIMAPIEAKELHRLNEELGKHGDFVEPSFDEYKPHATIAYVKPEAADRYVGMNLTDGKKFRVDSVTISKRDGTQEVVPLRGTQKGTTNDSVESQPVVSGAASPKSLTQQTQSVTGLPSFLKKAKKSAQKTSAPNDRLKDLVAKPDQLEQQYNALGTPDYVSGDKVKELLPEWKKKEQRGQLEEHTHTTASKAAYDLFHRKLERVGPGDQVTLVTGPVGAGKSTFSEGQKGLVYEVNLSNYAHAKEHVESVLARGATPSIRYVYVDPATSAERRALRAMEDGRPVRITRSVGQHLELPETLQRLHKEYGDRIDIKAVDNSGSTPRVIPIDQLNKLRYTGSEKDLLHEQQSKLDQLRNGGQINATTHANLSMEAGQRAERPTGVEESKQSSGVSKSETSSSKVKSPLPPFLKKVKKVSPIATERREVISTAKKEYSSTSQIAGADGSETNLLTPDGQKSARYRVVEAATLQPSHNAQTFAKNAAYPEGVQERTYDTSKEAQQRVIQQTQKYDPNYTINTNPDAVNGPPIITPDGVVLGGNSRAMATQRLYKDGNGNRYRSALLAQARTFGLDKAAIDGMKEPVLVREVQAPKTIDEMRSLGSQLNKSMTGALGVTERAVSAGKAITRQSLNDISGMLDSLGGDATLRELLRERGKDVLNILIRDGAITERERPQFVDTATGGLSEEGKTFVERALLGSIVDDPRLMDAAPKSTLARLDGSLAAISSLSPRTDAYNIIPLIREAIRDHAEIAQRGAKVDDYLAQAGLFGDGRDPAVDAMVRLLAEKPTAVKAKFRQFAQDANFDQQGQGTLLLGEQPSPSSAFNAAFGTDITDEQLENSIVNAASFEPIIGNADDRVVQGETQEGAGDLQRPAAREAGPGSESNSDLTRSARSETAAAKPTDEVTPEKKRPPLFGDESGSFDPSKIAEAALKAKTFIADEARKVRESRELDDGIFTLEKQQEADQLRATQWVKQAPGTPKDWEAVYHHIENPAEPVTASQRQLLDLVKPIEDESKEIFTKLTDGGAPIQNHIHRVVQERGGMLDRIMSSMGIKGGGRSNVLSKYASATKGRTMFALEDDKGNRAIVAIKGGRVTEFRGGQNVRATDLGGFREGLNTERGLIEEKVAPLEKKIAALDKERRILKANPSRTRVTFQRRKNISIEIDKLERQRDAIIDSIPAGDLNNKVWISKSGDKWTIQQATTKEIEANTDLRYYHHALASIVTSYLELRRAERAYDFLEAFKADPHFSEIAVEKSAGTPPKGWKATQVDQFRNYYFRPHEAEVLDRFAAQMRRDPVGVAEKIGSYLRTSIFFNPFLHIPNIVNHWAVEKGVRGFFPDRWHASLRAGVKAVNAVVHQNADYLEALDSGAPLQSHRDAIRDFSKLMFEKMTNELNSNPTVAGHVSKALGYANPAKLVGALYKLSSKATWLSNDIGFMQAVYEKTAQGMPLQKAIDETGKHIPNYRIPTRIFDSPGLSKLMSNPNITMFGAYHYGALRSYGEMAKSLLGDVPLKERAHALSLIAMAALVAVVAYPLADQLLKALTKNKDAELRRAGSTTLPYNLYLLLKGEKSPTEVLESVVTPAVQTKDAVELAVNRDLRTGRKIYDPHSKALTLAWQLLHKAAGSVAPLGNIEQAGEGQGKRTALGFLGIGFRKHGAEKISRDIAYSKMGTQAPTPESEAKAAGMRTLRDAADNGDIGPAKEALKNHEITNQQFQQLVRTSQGKDLVDLTRDMSYEEFMKVYDVATPEEKQLLDRELKSKQSKAKAKGATVQPSKAPFFLRPFLHQNAGSQPQK